MTGPELAAIRAQLGLSLDAMGRALGYTGDRNTVQVAMSRFEAGHRPIPLTAARLAVMFGRHGVPDDFLDGPAPG